MSATTIEGIRASWSPPLATPDSKPSDADIARLDSEARRNLDIAFHLVPHSMVRKPNILFIYYDQRGTLFPTVPVDLQLEWFLKNYTTMAQHGFVARQEGQDKKIMRGIWFYGVDDHHSFSRHKRTTRANLIAMAYLMANNFPRSICNPDTERFVLAFVDAWMSDLVDTGRLGTQSFQAREDFIDLWEDSAFDLMEFTKAQEEKTTKLIKKLRKQSLPPNLCDRFDGQPEQIIRMRRQGLISDEEFKKYGPALILEYILSMSELSNQNRDQRQTEADQLEAEMARRIEYRQRLMDDDIRRRVKWDSRLVNALLGAVDSNALHPSVIRRQRPAQLREPWLDMPTFFEIMELGLEAVEEETDEVFDLFASLAT